MEQQENIPVIRKKRELKYTGTILKFYEDTVVVNGHEAHWVFIHHDGARQLFRLLQKEKF